MREVRVMLPWCGQRIHVGSLRKERGEFVFLYSLESKEHKWLPRLSAFPELACTYRSRRLFPFFRVRIPPLDREDVSRVVEERGIDKGDTLALLVALGAKTPTSPYELEFARGGAEKEDDE